MRKTVIVMGSGNSGSGAVYDYLALRPDFYSPLHQEFRLVQDPGGIMDLHAALVFGFHVNRASAAVDNFIDLCHRCGRDKSTFHLGLAYRKSLTEYDLNVQKFINAITAVEYKGMSFSESSKLSKWETYFYRKKHKRAKKKGYKFLHGITRLPVTEQDFLKEAQIFLNSIFDINHIDPEKKLSIALDHGGSFWKPSSSLRYYGQNCKAIIVSRDPRGIFSSFKTKGRAYPGQGVHLFCKWYKNMMKHVDYSEWGKSNVLHIQFEDFVIKFEEEKVKLDNFLGIPSDVQSSLNVSQSAFNSEKYRDRLKAEEMEVIEKELKEYLYF